MTGQVETKRAPRWAEPVGFGKVLSVSRMGNALAHAETKTSVFPHRLVFAPGVVLAQGVPPRGFFLAPGAARRPDSPLRLPGGSRERGRGQAAAAPALEALAALPFPGVGPALHFSVVAPAAQGRVLPGAAQSGLQAAL